MKKVVVLAIFLAAAYAPSAFAVAELTLVSGASHVDILDGSAGDSCGAGVDGCVTFNGTVGSWKVNVTTGIEDGVPFFDLGSVDSTNKGKVKGTQAAPITLSFSDDGVIFPEPELQMKVGGTINSTKPALISISFSDFTDTVKFGKAHQVGSTLTFHTSPYGATTKATAVPAGDSAVTLVALINIGNGASGSASFDSALEAVPEPASVTMLGGVLLVLGGALRRRIKKA